MRYALISDLHANRQAFNAVMADIACHGVDEIICLGDVVGYGPAPAAVLESAYAKVHHFVLGNHDAVLCGKVNSACFNDNARQIIDWTSRRLDSKASAFFGTLPLLIEGGGFCCAHAEFAAPARYGYVLDPQDAVKSWQAREEPLLFVGHSHSPCLFVVGDSGTPHMIAAQDFCQEENKRYIVNVGSVGQPRDGDLRGCYCIYDVDRRSVFFRKVSFDIDSYRAELMAAELPAQASYFLQVAERKTIPPVREMLDFRPSEETGAAQATDVKRLVAVERSVRRWRTTGVLLALLLLLVCAASGALLLRRQGAYTIPALASAGGPVLAEALALTPAVIGEVSKDNPLPQWSVTMVAPGALRVVTETVADDRRGEYAVFHLFSETPAPFTLRSLPMPVERGRRLQVKCAFQSREFRSGYAEIALVCAAADGTERLLCHARPANPGATARWRPLSKAMETGLEIDGQVAMVIRGEFSGELLVRDCQIIVKE